MYSYTSMTDWHSLASFPSNEPNSPSSIVGLVVAALLVALLVWIARRGSLVSGIAAGAVVFALASAALFWPRVLREPYAPNPGPLLVLIGAFAGGCCGAVSALLGKVVQELSLRDRKKNSESLGHPSAESENFGTTNPYCSYCRKNVAIDSEDRCLECRWPIDD